MSTQTPKTMSSRLMTMKFMQRAAASTSSVPHSHARSSDAPPFKRQKVSSVPSSTVISPSNLQLIQVALAEEEEKRGKAIERLAEDAGETNWILSTVNGDGAHGVGGIRITKAGYSDIDQEGWRPALIGRTSFGKFNQELESTDRLCAYKRQDSAADKSSSSGEIHSEPSEDDREERDDSVRTGVLYRASKEEATRRVNDEGHQRQQQQRAEKAELARLADKRRSKQVKLNKLSSISGGGGGGGKPGGGSKLDMECFFCGEKGHAKRECPQKRKRWNEDGHSEVVEN